MNIFVVFIIALGSHCAFGDFNQDLQKYVLSSSECHQIQNGSCPEWLTDRRANFRERSFIDNDKPFKLCSAELKLTKAYPLDIERELQSSDLISHNLALSENFGGCFDLIDHDFEDIKLITKQARCESMSSGKNRCLRNLRVSKSSSRERSSLNQILVADYYHQHLKLRTGVEEAARGIGYIDRVLGRAPLEDIKCDALYAEKARPLCTQIQADECKLQEKAKAEKSHMLELTESIILKLRQLENERDLIDQESDLPRSERKKLKSELDEEMSSFEQMAPWIQGEKFSEHRSDIDKAITEGNTDALKQAIEKGFEKQFLENRNFMLKQLQELNKTSMCLDEIENCSDSEIESALKMAPKLDTEGLPNNEHLNFLGCLEEKAEQSDQRDRVARDVAIGVGLTVASILAPPVSVVRVVSAAGQITRNAKLGHRAVTAALVTADVYFAADSIAHAHKECFVSKRAINFKAPKASNGEFSCDEERTRLSAGVNFSPNECLKAVLFASLDSIPLMALGTKQAYFAFKNFKELSKARRLRRTQLSANFYDPPVPTNLDLSNSIAEDIATYDLLNSAKIFPTNADSSLNHLLSIEEKLRKSGFQTHFDEVVLNDNVKHNVLCLVGSAKGKNGNNSWLSRIVGSLGNQGAIGGKICYAQGLLSANGSKGAYETRRNLILLSPEDFSEALRGFNPTLLHEIHHRSNLRKLLSKKSNPRPMGAIVPMNSNLPGHGYSDFLSLDELSAFGLEISMRRSQLNRLSAAQKSEKSQEIIAHLRHLKTEATTQRDLANAIEDNLEVYINRFSKPNAPSIVAQKMEVRDHAGKNAGHYFRIGFSEEGAGKEFAAFFDLPATPQMQELIEKWYENQAQNAPALLQTFLDEAKKARANAREMSGQARDTLSFAESELSHF